MTLAGGPGARDSGRVPAIESPTALAGALAGAGYLADAGLATAGYLALRLGKPVFLEGEAGVGKTSFATALAQATGLELIRLQCYEGLDAAQALYDWDFPRQLLHLRAAEAAGTVDADRLEQEIYDRRFLVARPLLQALEAGSGGRRAVLLVDEVDRADDEFEAFLLEVLSDWTISVPELGTIRAEVPPVVVVTSNRTREVHDALKRRCLYHWLPHPDVEREVAIIRRRLPEATEGLATSVARIAALARGEDLLKPPGVAESLDWTEALLALGARSLGPAELDRAAASLGAFVKYREDQDRVAERLAEWAAAG